MISILSVDNLVILYPPDGGLGTGALIDIAPISGRSVSVIINDLISKTGALSSQIVARTAACIYLQ